VNAPSAARGEEDMVAFLSCVLDSLRTNIFLCDLDLKIMAINAAALENLRRLNGEIRGAYGADIDRLIGLSIYRFVREPARLQAILGDPALLPYEVDVTVGPAVFRARFDALRSPNGQTTGYAVVCEEVSRQRETERELLEAVAQRETLQREVHRRVGSSLQLVMSLARLESDAPRGEALPPAWAPAWCGHMKSIARVHELIYDGDDVSRVDVDAYVRKLIHWIVAEHAAPESRIKIETAVGVEIRDLDTLIDFGLALCELAANSVKHAFPAGRAGRIRVTAQAAGGVVEAVVSDDGVGPSSDLAVRAGFGLKLASALIEGQLKGKFRIENRMGGMAFVLSFPIAPA
jgi:two-component sensor histidine kinase